MREGFHVTASQTGHERNIARRSVPPSEAAANQRCSYLVYITGRDVSHTHQTLNVTVESLTYTIHTTKTLYLIFKKNYTIFKW